MIATETSAMTFSDIELVLSGLIEKAKIFDMNTAVKIMKEIVPEYLSKNSKYESLDTKK